MEKPRTQHFKRFSELFILLCTVQFALQAATISRTINSSSDDAAEAYATNAIQLSDDIELGWDDGLNDNERVGLRFTNISIPRNATINSAYVQFYADDVAPGNNATRTFRVQGQAADNPPTFTTATSNISSRPLTTANVLWPTTEWAASAHTTAQRTTNIASIIQEIVNRGGWNSGNSLALIIGNTTPGTLPELVVNGNFSDGGTGWGYWIVEPAAGTVYIDGNGGLKMQVDNAGTSIDHFAVVQGGLSLIAGHQYEIGFYIASTISGKQFLVCLEEDGNDYTRHFGSYDAISAADLTYQFFKYSWIQSTTDSNVRLCFMIGSYNTDDVWIDNVSLKDISETGWRRTESFDSYSSRAPVLTIDYTEPSGGNNPPTDILLSSSTVAENQPAGTTVGTLSAVDPDAGSSHTFSLVSGTGSTDNARFSISGSTLQTAAIFDCETQNSYAIRLQANDGQGGTFQKAFTITLSNVNEGPTDITLSSLSVNENSPAGTSVGTLSAVDPDIGDAHTFTLVSGTGSTDNARFSISGTTLQTAAIFDYETQSSYAIRIRAVDAAGLSIDKIFTIMVSNVNEAPTDIVLSATTVATGQAIGSVVGSLSAPDPDSADSHIFALVTGSGSVDNASFTINSGKLYTAAPVNYATQASYSIRIRAIDLAGNSREKVFTISVESQSYAPQNLQLSTSGTLLAEGASLTLQASADASPEPSIIWYRINPDGSAKALDTASGLSTQMQIASCTKSDSARYFCIATNGVQPDAVSDTVSISVLTPPRITVQPTDRWAIPGGAATISLTGIGDHLTFQWYRNGTLLTGATQSSVTRSPVTTADSASHYHCIVSNSVGKDTSLSASLHVGTLYNPFHCSAYSPDPRHPATVTLTLSCDQTVAQFPYTTSAQSPWADSLIIVYTTNGFPARVDQTGANRLAIWIGTIDQAPDDRLVVQRTLAALPAITDGYYYLAYTLKWHNPDSLLPLIPTTSLLMHDTTRSDNPLTVTGAYVNSSATALITVNNANALDTYDQHARFIFSTSPGTSAALIDTQVLATTLVAQGSTCTFTITHPTFQGALDTIYTAWFVSGINGLNSDTLHGWFTVGQERPAYTGALIARAGSRSDQIVCTWDAPDQPVDSIRLWWNTLPISLSANITLNPLHALKSSPDATTLSVSGLNPATTYYFGLQVFREGLWSVITAAASASATTGSQTDTLTITNTLAIDTAWFDPAGNTISANWNLVLPSLPQGTILQAGWSQGASQAAVKNNQPAQWVDISGTAGTARIDPGAALVFNTNWYIGCWVRTLSQSKGPGLPVLPTDQASATVPIPAFSWEVVTVMPPDIDTLRVNGGTFMLARDPLIQSYPSGIDTVRAWTPVFSTLNGMQTINCGFVFALGYAMAPVWVGMRIGTLPAGVIAEDVRLYRDSSGVAVIERDYRLVDGVIWVRTRDLTRPFLLMVDTRRPQTTFLLDQADTAGILLPGTSVPYVFAISDNIANCRWSLQYGKGNTGYDIFRGATLSVIRDTITAVIAQSEVSEAYGLRARLIVDDGTYADTFDLSRSVQCRRADVVVTPPQKWVPIRAAALLDNPAAHIALADLAGDDRKWTYDKNSFRLFRWDDASDDEYAWMEYSERNADEFTFSPDRLMWIKTANMQTINLGSGITTPLKQTRTVRLPARRWTDLCLPYKFDVPLADIVKATGVEIFDSLEVYHWSDDQQYYQAEAFYIPHFDNLTGKSLVYAPLNDGYTVYNRFDHDVMIHIPPVPAPLSSYSSTLGKTARDPQRWDVWVSWRDTDAGTVQRRIRCGFDAGGDSEPTYSPLPPSFSKVNAGVYDSGAGRLYGHSMQHILQDGGLCWQIRFCNQEDRARTIEYTLGNLDCLPPGMQARLFEAQTPLDASQPLRTTIAAGGQTRRWLAVGSPQYLDQLAARMPGSLRAAMLTAYPNPARQRLQIRYVLPALSAGQQVHCALYAMNGRCVWQRRLGAAPAGAPQTVQWDGSDASGTRAVAGMYLVRMSLVHTDGSRQTIGSQKITYLP